MLKPANSYEIPKLPDILEDYRGLLTIIPRPVLKQILRNEVAFLRVDPIRTFYPRLPAEWGTGELVGGELPVKDAHATIKPTNAITAVGYTRGWHVCYLRDRHKRFNTKHFGDKWPLHAIEDTLSAELHPRVVIAPTDLHFFKGTGLDDDGYSGFEGTDEDGQTLGSVLKGKNVSVTIVMDLAIDYCVKATVLDALKFGFTVIVPLDCCRAVDVKPGDGIRAVKEMADAGAIITTSHEIMAAISM